MRDHRLIDERTITLPWCLTAIATAHTFPRYSETFLPVCNWASTSMVFPPVTSTTNSVYRTCLLSNNGDNPLLYSFENDETNIFTCKPSISLLRDRYQLTVFRMSPMEIGSCKRNIKCILNDTEKYAQNFELLLTAEIPQVVLTPNDYVYFKPTCICNVSNQAVTVKNTSRMSLR